MYFSIEHYGHGIVEEKNRHMCSFFGDHFLGGVRICKINCCIVDASGRFIYLANNLFWMDILNIESSWYKNIRWVCFQLNIMHTEYIMLFFVCVYFFNWTLWTQKYWKNRHICSFFDDHFTWWSSNMYHHLLYYKMVLCGRCFATYHLGMILDIFRLDPLGNQTWDPRRTKPAC